jgi:predicted RND superfamily exporter protein
VGLEVTGGGPVLMFAYLGERNVRSMLIALTAALMLAAAVLGLSLRSWRIAAVGLACNILPVLLVYSLWAVFKGRISLGGAVVMGMIIGIVIDDTIYLLTTYRRALAARVADPVSQALRRVGPALIVTTITLVASLSLGLLSDFEPIWSMSALSVAIIGLALLVDLLLLPAMLPSEARAGGRKGATGVS